MSSCLIVGGGVVGLSLAYELSCRGWQVRVIDRGPLGREASWAGAGILPPTNAETALHPLDRLRALSNEIHAEWSQRLLKETGIDNGLRRSGGIYLAQTAGEAASLAAMARSLTEERIACERLSPEQLIAAEPALAALARSQRFRAAYLLPDEHQLRNPRHLAALALACAQRGVELDENCEATDLLTAGSRITGVVTPHGTFTADCVAITAGPWTRRLLADQSIATGIYPVRGQIVLFRCERPPFTHILNEGPRYLVPREDGHVLAGATEEEVGFEKSNTPQGIAELTEFAIALVPQLGSATIVKTWAGLRPATLDGFPYIGRVPGLDNAFVAAGHFRSGLHMSTGTAVLLAQLMSGENPQIDLEPFRVARG